jgi:hypothetical protein
MIHCFCRCESLRSLIKLSVHVQGSSLLFNAKSKSKHSSINDDENLLRHDTMITIWWTQCPVPEGFNLQYCCENFGCNRTSLNLWWDVICAVT